jgi:ABC-type uncharacterized transport system substrate-binding protein
MYRALVHRGNRRLIGYSGGAFPQARLLRAAPPNVEIAMPHRSALGFASIIVIIGAVLFCAPRTLAQGKAWRIAWLDPSVSPTAAAPSRNLAAFQDALGKLGYTESRNYILDARFADTDQSRLPALAKELVDRGVDVIVTVGTPTVRAAKEATATIPIVMAGSSNPVERGLVSSLAHPGGNVTGVTSNPGPEFNAKALQLLKEAAPNISRVAVLVESFGVPLAERLGALPSAAEHLKLRLLPHDVADVKSGNEYGIILSKIIEERADALFVLPDFVNDKYWQLLTEFMSTSKIPSMCQQPRCIEQGGLLYYFTDWFELRRQAAVYVDKILRGTRPADLPVEEPSKFQLIVNLKTAEALGLTLPQTILGMADKVIE